MMVLHDIDLVGSWIGTVVALVPRLTAFGAPAWNTRRTGWRRWRIGGWRFGRILRMLVEAGFEIGHLRLELSQLLLLLGHNRQQCRKGVLDEERRRGPVIGRDTVW
jgi:hypothetical protein